MQELWGCHDNVAKRLFYNKNVWFVGTKRVGWMSLMDNQQVAGSNFIAHSIFYPPSQKTKGLPPLCIMIMENNRYATA
jgi:hypothetical protein